ncbi:amiloride-sensitive amine oxidase [copper-containing] isoform X2 [Pristis pectinata]|uniref:amiloride-sensitive amine oxidase [copper-containing] isoform X2 n=1 Tax=Pristis pectinata TaxID=685728 RepID=UPI00223DED3F|nr:amiloride-sensitive amine oxidase [copper-containing] isoform X2 [Pristis pectinata]
MTRVVKVLWLLLCLAVLREASPPPESLYYQRRASVFADLSVPEVRTVRSFLLSQKHLNLSAARTPTLNKNYIFLIELLLPKKEQVLDFLQGHVCPPQRKARVVVFFGAEPAPNVTEYVVGPLPLPRYHYPIRTRSSSSIKFTARPITSVEYQLLHSKITQVTEVATPLLRDISGFSFHNCTDRCLTFTDVAPRGERSGDRKSWFIIQRAVEGYFLHPIGLEILLNHESVDPEHWVVEKVWYNGQYFDSVDELVEKYNRGLVAMVKLPDLHKEDLFSSYRPRGHLQTRAGTPGPKVWEPYDKRYWVKGNSVMYAGWTFAFRVRSSTGIQLFDIRFNSEPIAYEVSLQEAIAFYTGHSPATMQTKYIDTAWGMGVMGHELAKGIDCPEFATYRDTYHLLDSDQPVHYRNTLCIFEYPTAVPLRRHYNSNSRGGYNFYAGLEGQVLLLRTTSTVYNYDYLWDFIFHQNGVMEVKVHATGYIHASFFTTEGLNYGTRVHQHLLGNLHTHLVHYRVDLDVAGTSNSFETLEMKLEKISNPWSPGDHIVQPRLDRVQRERERSAAFAFRKRLPRYQLAVTRYRDSESCSSSLYVQNDPWDPNVNFERFIRNNENITNQDLVAWVTVGFLHIPHAEDIPNTSTPGNSVGFFLRPFNFFQEDPSVASRDVVIVRPVTGSVSEVNIQRWTEVTSPHCPVSSPFTYNGTYLPV